MWSFVFTSASWIVLFADQRKQNNYSVVVLQNKKDKVRGWQITFYGRWHFFHVLRWIRKKRLLSNRPSVRERLAQLDARGVVRLLNSRWMHLFFLFIRFLLSGIFRRSGHDERTQYVRRCWIRRGQSRCSKIQRRVGTKWDCVMDRMNKLLFSSLHH